MNRFVLKNTFIRVYIYHFSINIFTETRSQSCVLKTVSLSKTTFFTSTEGVLSPLEELLSPPLPHRRRRQLPKASHPWHFSHIKNLQNLMYIVYSTYKTESQLPTLSTSILKSENSGCKSNFGEPPSGGSGGLASMADCCRLSRHPNSQPEPTK
jgi:hypothetical protein